MQGIFPRAVHAAQHGKCGERDEQRREDRGRRDPFDLPPGVHKDRRHQKDV